MTKAELVDQVAKATGLSKKDSEAALDTTFEVIKKSIKKESGFRYPGFGTFSVKKRKARTGINPQTGQKIKVKASKTVGFKPAQAFKSKL
jgi:DNA-binding protein HU-beta